MPFLERQSKSVKRVYGVVCRTWDSFVREQDRGGILFCSHFLQFIHLDCPEIVFKINPEKFFVGFQRIGMINLLPKETFFSYFLPAKPLALLLNLFKLAVIGFPIQNRHFPAGFQVQVGFQKGLPDRLVNSVHLDSPLSRDGRSVTLSGSTR